MTYKRLTELEEGDYIRYYEEEFCAVDEGVLRVNKVDVENNTVYGDLVMETGIACRVVACIKDAKYEIPRCDVSQITLEDQAEFDRLLKKYWANVEIAKTI